MKQLYEEIKNVCNWCSCCRHTYIAEEAENPDKEIHRPDFSMSSATLLMGIMEPVKGSESKGGGEIIGLDHIHDIVEKAVAEAIGDDVPMLEVSEEERDEWPDWEKMYESYQNYSCIMRCPYLRKKGLMINIDREYVIPEDERETLRLLDKIAQCYSQECRFNKRDHYGVKTVDGLMRVAIAKLDFALIETGKDYGKLMHDMYFPYYERKSDIYGCGYSWELIRYYMDKYGFPLKSNEEYEAEDTRTQARDFESSQEFKDALADHQCDEKGRLLVKKAEFTRYAANKYDITCGHKQFWTRFDNIFTDEKGKPIPFMKFAQSYRDQEQRH